MTAALRAIWACRPSGLSRRPSSPVRSTSRVRLACIASSLRRAFSLRRRCFRTPAASSISARRVSGPGVDDLVELALPDDDVHLPAEAGVGQQFLDVQQPAMVAVDRVLALPGPEQQAADRHLGVVDRQGAVAVVDGQRDLGAAEGGAAGGAGEDDVLHLAAAQRLGPLLAHDPGEGVHDVGLARPVGPTTQVMPGSKRREVAEAKDLKPRRASVLTYTRRTPSLPIPGCAAAWSTRTLPWRADSAADCAARGPAPGARERAGYASNGAFSRIPALAGAPSYIARSSRDSFERMDDRANGAGAGRRDRGGRAAIWPSGCGQQNTALVIMPERCAVLEKILLK